MPVWSILGAILGGSPHTKGHSLVCQVSVESRDRPKSLATDDDLIEGGGGGGWCWGCGSRGWRWWRSLGGDSSEGGVELLSHIMSSCAVLPSVWHLSMEWRGAELLWVSSISENTNMSFPLGSPLCISETFWLYFGKQKKETFRILSKIDFSSGIVKIFLSIQNFEAFCKTSRYKSHRET